MGRHERADDKPGRDKLYPAHSAEDRAAETGMVTRTDLQRLAGIAPRDTPPGGVPMAHPPHRRARSGSTAPRYYSTPDEGGPAEPGRSVEPSLRARVISVILVSAVLVALIWTLGGDLWV